MYTYGSNLLLRYRLCTKERANNIFFPFLSFWFMSLPNQEETLIINFS